jgi:hypothetical protein
VQEHARLVEREPGALGDVEDFEALDGVGAVAALAAVPLRFGEHTDALVVPDSRRLEAETLRELADGERRLVHGDPP